MSEVPKAARDRGYMSGREFDKYSKEEIKVDLNPPNIKLTTAHQHEYTIPVVYKAIYTEELKIWSLSGYSVVKLRCRCGDEIRRQI